MTVEIDWIDMVRYQQQVQKITRLLLPSRKGGLTASECELLAWLHLNPEYNTPVVLSQCSGMKKEAVSRCIKGLFEKGCITKEKHDEDERSYRIYLTEKGYTELKHGYEAILKPFYQLQRSIGSDFERLLEYTDRIVSAMETKRREG